MVRSVSVRARAKDEEGVVLILVALGMTLLTGLAAFVIDLGNARQESRQAQASADAAALAAASVLPAVGPDPLAASSVKAKAAAYAATNVLGYDQMPSTASCDAGVPPNSSCYAAGDATITVATPYSLSSSSVASHRLVYVQICEETETFFASVIGQSSPTVCRDAVARKVPVGTGTGRGLIALDRDDPGALTKDGSNVLVTVNGGDILVNSGASNSAQCNASGSHTPPYNGSIRTPDGNSYLGGAMGGNDCFVVDPFVNQPLSDDPLATLPELDSTGMTTYPGGSITTTTTLQPGRYTNRITVQSNDITVTLAPGHYYLSGGLTCEGNTKYLVGNGVFLFIGDDAGGNPDANLRIAGNCRATLSPPTSGTYQGIVAFQDRENDNQAQFEGNGTGVSGTIYMPGNEMRVAGNNSQTFDSAMIVVNTIEIAGNGVFTLNTHEPPQATPREDELGLEL